MNLTVWSHDENFDGMILDSHTEDRYKDRPMQKKLTEQIWLDVKYGKLMKPYFSKVTDLENIHGTNCGQWDTSTGA